MIGRVNRRVDITAKTTSVNSRKTKSGTPQLKFHLLAKQKFKKLLKIVVIIEMSTIILVSTFLHQAL